MGVEKFNAFCRSKVLGYVDDWEKTVERIARWTEFKKAYKTMDNEYIESVWWAFKELHKKEFLYQSEKILMYCPRCETPLSKSEIAMDNSYRTVKDDTITVAFKLADQEAYFLAWTTTPWTLPSNLALTVNLKLNYVFVKRNSDGKVYVLAKEALSRCFKNAEEYKIIKEVLGKELIGKKYEPLFPYFERLKSAFKIISGTFVTSESGTGIVHTAPAFGEDDYRVCKENNIDFIQPVDKQGKFTKDVIDFSGEYIRDANPKIIEFLKKQGKIFRIEKKEHEYPFCYRCETPLMYRALPAWFIDIQRVKKRMLELNEKMLWHPEFLKYGRFKHTIDTAPDWNITRNRYWASAIPVWECVCGERKIIGSIAELKKEAVNLKGKIDLHKDYLDKVQLKCSCGKRMNRIPEVLDCWFESGSMPFAQFHYPFENKKEFESTFPADFVSEYIAQTRTWFYYCLVLSTILFDNIPFKNVATTGNILAEDGEKMSKSKGNYPDPSLIFERYGVDSLRFYLLSSNLMHAEDSNFSEKGVGEVHKRVLLLLYNVAQFYSEYSKKDLIKDPNSKNILDRWIISKLHGLIRTSTQGMDEYDTMFVCAEIKKFVDDLSTWYVRRNRDRFNNEDVSARKTLAYVLQESSKILAPIMPFVSEFLYRNALGSKDSVHLQSWPSVDKKKIDELLEKNMEITRELVSLALKERDRLKISLKQPLAKIRIEGFVLPKEFSEIIADELNVKKVVFEKGEDKDIEFDTVLTEDLIAEGFAREIARKIQGFRKDVGLDKKDFIDVEVIVDENLEKILKKEVEFLKERVHSKGFFINTSSTKRYKNGYEFVVKEKTVWVTFEVHSGKR